MKTKDRNRVPSRIVIAVLLCACALLAVLMLSWKNGMRALTQPGRGSIWSKLSASDGAGKLRFVRADNSQTSESTSSKVQGTIRGADGKPIAHATVCASCYGCDILLVASGPKCVRTDANGRYTLEGLTAGDYLISVAANGHAPTVANKARALTIGKKGGPSDFDVDSQLEEGGAPVTGVVMDALGGPVPDATVRAFFAPPNSPVIAQSTVSDAQGAFSLAGPAGPLELMAYAEGYAPSNADRTAPCSGVQLIITPASTIRGKVLTAVEGVPVAGARVLAEGPAWSRQQATTDQAGLFEIAGLRPGVYRLRATGDKWIGEYPESVSLDLVDTVDNVVLFVNGAVRVEGQLLLSDQSPCTYGKVRLAPPPNVFSVPMLEASPNVEGSVLFEAVPAGTYVVSAFCDGSGSQKLAPLEVGAEDLTGVRWQLQPRLSIEGRVVDADGNPVSGLQMLLVSAISQFMDSPASGRVAQALAIDADGHFAVKGLLEGSYTIEGEYLEAPVNVVLSQANSPVSLKLVVNVMGQIAVTVSDPRGEPVDGLTVHATGSALKDATKSVHTATAMGAGKYQLGPLAAGSYIVETSDGVNPPVRAGGPAGSVNVVARETAALNITFGGYGAAIAGQVLDEAGTPLESIFVSAVATDLGDHPIGAFNQATREKESLDRLTDAEGNFVLDGLSEGGVFVVVARRAQGGQSTLENVKAGSNVRVVLPSVGNLSGNAVNAEGRPVDRFSILFVNAETKEQRSQSFARPDGGWSIQNVSPGPLRISARGLTGGEAMAELILEPNEDRKAIQLVLGPAKTGTPAGPEQK